MRHTRSVGSMCLLVLALASCGTRFSEVHFYRVDTAKKGQPNYYRLTIAGKASFSKAKYISGCYDERAVQIVFDEIGTKTDGEAISFLSGGEVEVSGAKVTTIDLEDKVCPPGKSKLMIFSTNAKVVADTIGAFAESQVVADALVGWARQGEVDELAHRQGSLALETSTQVSETREIASLVNALPTDDAPDRATTEAAALRLLNAIARAQGRFEPLMTVDEARLWFQMRQTMGGRL